MPEEQLPLLLPDTDNFKPSGTPESPLSVIEDWVNTVDPASGRPARRETSTMPQVHFRLVTKFHPRTRMQFQPQCGSARRS